MRTLAPIRVRREEPCEWTAVCRSCTAYIFADNWDWVSAWGLGHLSLKHPQWPSAQLDTDGSRK